MPEARIESGQRHSADLVFSLLASVKAHARPVQLAVNDATGGGLVVAPSVTLCDVEPLPPLLSVTVRLTVYVPLAV